MLNYLGRLRRPNLEPENSLRMDIFLRHSCNYKNTRRTHLPVGKQHTDHMKLSKRKFQAPMTPSHSQTGHLLPLIRDLHCLLAALERHSCRVLLGRYGALLGFVLDEGDPLPAGHQTHLAETVEAAENLRKRIHGEVVGEVLNEENLVRRQVLVGNNRGGGRSGGLESSAARGLRGSGGEVWGCSGSTGDWPLETLLLFCGFERSFLIYATGRGRRLVRGKNTSPNRTGVHREREALPFSARRLLRCVSNSSASPVILTVASLLVRASASCIGFSKSSKPWISSMAFCADSGLSKTTKAWPFALRFVFAMMSITFPYSEKIASRDSLRTSGLTRSSRLRT